MLPRVTPPVSGISLGEVGLGFAQGKTLFWITAQEALRRAEAAGYTAIVFAIDAFAPGSSDSTIRMQFSMPASLKLVNAGQSGYKTSLGWDDVKFIQQNTKLPLVLKGVLTPEMAKLALQHGVAAIQVSNHGGRQLDGVPAAFDALPAVVDVVKGKVPVIMAIGMKEVEERSVSIRRLDRQGSESQPLESAIQALASEATPPDLL